MTPIERGDANERMALLLGWERDTPIARVWRAPDGVERGGVFDYTSWERFPEMQEFARGQFFGERARIQSLCTDKPPHGPDALRVTPTILRDAILEVCDDV